VIPPLLTPLRDRDALDLEGLERLVEHTLGGGAKGLFILGTTGEGPSLSYRLRRELIRRVCAQAAGRAPVLVGITDTAFVESVELARFAADQGARAVVAAPPYYMPEGQPELREYLAHLIEQLPLPLILYNMPPLTKVPYAIDTVRWAIEQPKIIGIKDSSGDMTYFEQILLAAQARPDWSVLIGPEELLGAATLMGGGGGVSGGANIFPRLYAALYRAARTGDLERTRELQRRACLVGEKLYTIGRHPSALIKGLKCAAALMGICLDFMAEPFHRFRKPERERVRAVLEEIKDLVQDV